ncbi:MAG: DegV family protein [Halanaerobiales bacterium]
MKIGILTDSTCDLGPDLLERYGIEMVPLVINFSEEEVYRDKLDITNQEFFTKLVQAEKLPTTSQPAIGWFVDKYKEMAESYDAIISIHLAESLSGTCHSARMAANQVEDVRIEVIDSASASMGIGFQVLLARKLAEEGLEFEEIVERVKEMQKNLKIFFTVNDLSYLEKGGRIGKASAFLGSILNFYPILNISEKNGEILPIEKIRGKKKIVKRMLELAKEEIENLEEVTLGFLHGSDLEYFDLFRRELLDYLEEKNISYSEKTDWISSVIGCHTGPTVYGVVLFKGVKLDL